MQPGTVTGNVVSRTLELLFSSFVGGFVSRSKRNISLLVLIAWLLIYLADAAIYFAICFVTVVKHAIVSGRRRRRIR